VEAQLAKIQDATVEVEGRDPVTQSIDAYTTALCFVGSTSLSHVLSCIDRHKDRLLTLANTGNAARFQIITSVLDYWRDKPGNGISIIDKLLNYTILTPKSVVEWVCTHHLRAGRTLAQPHTYEMVNQTLFKVTHRLRQLVAARLQPGLVQEQIDVIEESIAKETAAMKALFGIVEDATRGVAEGSADGLLDGEGVNLEDNADGNDRSEEEVARLRRWGAKWRRAFTRKLAIEEAWARESLATAPPPEEGAMDVKPDEGIADAPVEADSQGDEGIDMAE
jgi:nuclear cap-binding protein subunit 1